MPTSGTSWDLPHSCRDSGRTRSFLPCWEWFQSSRPSWWWWRSSSTGTCWATCGDADRYSCYEQEGGTKLDWILGFKLRLREGPMFKRSSQQIKVWARECNAADSLAAMFLTNQESLKSSVKWYWIFVEYKNKKGKMNHILIFLFLLNVSEGSHRNRVVMWHHWDENFHHGQTSGLCPGGY